MRSSPSSVSSLSSGLPIPSCRSQTEACTPRLTSRSSSCGSSWCPPSSNSSRAAYRWAASPSACASCAMTAGPCRRVTPLAVPSSASLRFTRRSGWLPSRCPSSAKEASGLVTCSWAPTRCGRGAGARHCRPLSCPSVSPIGPPMPTCAAFQMALHSQRGCFSLARMK